MPEISLARLLTAANELNASDVHAQHGCAPMVRVDGVVRYLEVKPLTAEQMHHWTRDLLDEHSESILNREGSCDLTHTHSDEARFRVNIFYQNDVPAIAFRRIHGIIPTVEELNLPEIIETIANRPRGLILVSGSTSSGKSTTIASMLGHINRKYARRIITIEDPVEFIHESEQSLVAQIEVGRDTRSYEDAVRHVLRQDPDVLMVGEIRDPSSLRVALRAADTGHLVFATVHATNAQQTIERIIAMFEPAQHQLLLTQLALNLQAVIAMRLAAAKRGGRVPVCEIMLGTGTVQKLILENRIKALQQAIANRDQEMQTFDQHLEQLYRSRTINAEETLRLATYPEALTMALRGLKTSDQQQRLVQ
jgi:twitching motility protein PilT